MENIRTQNELSKASQELADALKGMIEAAEIQDLTATALRKLFEAELNARIVLDRYLRSSTRSVGS